MLGLWEIDRAHAILRSDGRATELELVLAQRADDLLTELRAARKALAEYLDWGAMTSSDRDAFARQFRVTLARCTDGGDDGQ
jgi:hypothetical protein